MTVFVGVDGGATQATAVVVNGDGHTLARVQGQVALIREESAAAVAASLSELVRDALRHANSPRPDVLCAGLTGVGRATERDNVTAALSATGVADRVIVTTDAEAALFDAFGTGPGIMLIAGTGSVAWGRSASGVAQRAGGWGPLLGDGGSAYAIGLSALRAIAVAEDGMAPATSLRDTILETTRQPDATNLIRWADTAGRAEIAALARSVFALAPVDTVAHSIVQDAAAQLTSHASALARRLAPWPDGRAPVALSGGLLAAGRPLRDLVRARILQAQPPMRILDLVVDAARGAALLARTHIPA
jgi:glucosamine kinase